MAATLSPVRKQRITTSSLGVLYYYLACVSAAGNAPGIEYDYGVSPKFVCTPVPPDADPACFSPPLVPNPPSNDPSGGGARRGLMSDEAKATILHLRESLVRQKETILDQRETIRELTAKLTLCEGFGGHRGNGDHHSGNHHGNHHDDHHPSSSSSHHGTSGFHSSVAHSNVGGSHEPDPNHSKGSTPDKPGTFSPEQTGKTLQSLKERLENLQARNSTSSYSSSLRELLQRKIHALEEQLHSYHSDHHGNAHHNDHHGENNHSSNHHSRSHYDTHHDNGHHGYYHSGHHDSHPSAHLNHHPDNHDPHYDGHHNRHQSSHDNHHSSHPGHHDDHHASHNSHHVPHESHHGYHDNHHGNHQGYHDNHHGNQNGYHDNNQGNHHGYHDNNHGNHHGYHDSNHGNHHGYHDSNHGNHHRYHDSNHGNHHGYHDSDHGNQHGYHDSNHGNHNGYHDNHHGNHNGYHDIHHGNQNGYHDNHHGSHDGNHGNHHGYHDNHHGYHDNHHGNHNGHRDDPNVHSDHQHNSSHHDDHQDNNQGPRLLPLSSKDTATSGTGHRKLETVLSQLHKDPQHGNQKKFLLDFPLRSNYMFARMKPTLRTEIYAMTVCVRMKGGPGMGTPFSYAVNGQANELVLMEWGDNPMELLLNDQAVKLPITLSDHQWHHVCVTWTTRDGTWEVFQDGVKKGQGQNLSPWQPIKPGGVFILGQEQDSVGGLFDASQSFVGELSDVQLWSRVLSLSEVTAQASCGPHTQSQGDVLSWSEDNLELHGGLALLPFNGCH